MRGNVQPLSQGPLKVESGPWERGWLMSETSWLHGQAAYSQNHRLQ